MSSKSKRTSAASITYGSNRKRRIRDLSASSQEQTHFQKHPSPLDPQTDISNNDQPISKSGSSKKDIPPPAAEDLDDKEESEEEKEYEVETIKDHRQHGKVIQYLVKWKGYSSEDDSWEPAKHLTGALELLKKYKIQHNLDQKQNNGRASNASARSASKKAEKKKDLSDDDNDNQSHRKRKRVSQDKPKSTIAPLRKNGFNGPTKADRDSAANRVKAESSEDEVRESSVDEDEWHELHKKISSWESLIRSVRTIEKPGTEEGGENSPSAKQVINVCLLWKTGKTTWVSNQTARDKLPQKLLDFYEAHLQFSSGEQEAQDQD